MLITQVYSLKSFDHPFELVRWNRVQCFGHRLNLAITNVLKLNSDIGDAIDSCRSVSTHFAHAHTKLKQLEAVQKELKMPSHHLIKDCSTRWGSCFKMIERFLEQEPVVRRVLSADKKATRLIPTGEELAIIESVREALAPVAPFTDLITDR